MRILISNDDGYKAKGIQVLIKELEKIAQITVVAPSRNRSGASSSLSLDKPIKVTKKENSFYFLSGTPTDCVHIALTGLMQTLPDMVISGINHGPNLGDDTIYSGTVAGAIEGRFLGLPSIAISLASWECIHFETAGEIAKRLVTQIDKSELSYNTILNVNVPDIPLSEIKGIKSTRLGSRHKSEPSIKDKEDTSLYWIGENGKEADNSEGTDFHAISNNFVSVTPLQIDTTKHSEVKRVNDWLQKMDY